MNNKERYLLRFEMRADTGDEAEVMIYSAIESDKWFDDDVTPNDFDKALKDAVKGGAKKLNIRVNSPGGDVYSAVAMRSMVMNAGFKHVRVMIEGLCASAATLFATIPGAEVVIAEGSEFMIHNPMTIAIGNADDFEDTVKHLRKLEGQFHEMYAQKTGQDENTIKQWMDDETWFTAKEAVENGFADMLLESEPVAACVSVKDMKAMQAMYKSVPSCIGVTVPATAISYGDISSTDHTIPYNYATTTAGTSGLSKTFVYDVSTEAQEIAGAPTEINHSEEEEHDMDIKDMDMEQLRAENPALLEQIMQDAVAAERQRIEDIDALTDPGYEELAQKAKAEGTAPTDFVKQLVAAKKAKGAEFLAQRKAETEPAKDIAGGAPQDSAKSEADEIEAVAKEIAGYAMDYAGNKDESMF